MATRVIGNLRIVSNMALRCVQTEDGVVIYPDGGGSVTVTQGPKGPETQVDDVPQSTWVTVNGHQVAGRSPSPEEISGRARSARQTRVHDVDGGIYRNPKRATKKVGAARKTPKKRNSGQ